MAAKIAVIGSINMDLVTRSPRFPQVGETLLGNGFDQFMGGKGANQAVAAARLGADVEMIGAVGDDNFGRSLLANLQQEGVGCSGVKTVAGCPSGLANITVADNDNHIIVVSGANFRLTPADIEAHESKIAAADVVMSQLEIPPECVLTAARLARKHNKPFILNPAPAQKLSADLLALTTLLTPNSHELAISLGLPTDSPPEQMMQQAPCPVVMTNGSKGALFNDAEGRIHSQASFQVEPVDTTGAGDTFNGALAVFWADGLPQAVRHACAAAALSVTKAGAQSGMPTADALAEFFQQQNT